MIDDPAASPQEQLADFRRRVADLYAAVRLAGVSETSWSAWRTGRDTLFGAHPLSPIAAWPQPAPMPFWPYDPSWRLSGTVEPGEVAPVAIEVAGGRTERFDGVGRVRFDRGGHTHRLPIYWADSYGGGFFLPFRDETGGGETFGSGRYLLDGAKSADLGTADGQLILDFNFAYHPSCVWGDWLCPLPGPEGRLAVRVEAGERRPEGLTDR